MGRGLAADGYEEPVAGAVAGAEEEGGEATAGRAANAGVPIGAIAAKGLGGCMVSSLAMCSWKAGTTHWPRSLLMPVCACVHLCCVCVCALANACALRAWECYA